MSQDLEFLREQDSADRRYENMVARQEADPPPPEEEFLEVCPVCLCHDCTDEEHAAWVVADADAEWIKKEEQSHAC